MLFFMTNDTKKERSEQIAAITKAWYANRAKYGTKIADEIHDEAFRAILDRGPCR